MESPQKILLRNGFTLKEATVYLATLELGMAPISVIARKTRLQRSTTYEILQKLSAKGVAEFFIRKSTRYYSVIPPKLLLKQRSDALDDLRDVLPDMLALENNLVHKPRIRFFEGENDLKRLYLDVLDAKTEVLNFFLPETTVRYLTYPWLKKHMINELAQRSLHVRVIMPDSHLARRFLQERETPMRRQRIVRGKQYHFANEVGIYDDKVMYFSFDDNFAFLIESAAVAASQRAIFEMAWKGAEGLH